MDARIATYFGGGEVALDVGCGNGGAFDDVAARYATTLGLDIFPPCATSSPERPGWTFMLADLNRGIPVGDGRADAVHANQVIEHVANPLHFAQEAYRVLRPGGVFVVTTPNIQYLPHLWNLVVRGRGPITSEERCCTATNWDDGHIHFLTTTDLAWVARRSGFRRLQTRALVAPTGRLAPLRQRLDRWSASEIVKRYLSGVAMLVATK
ncbi:MAG: class I SAM-dependent methyltransferase [Dehalococcoidia bacterium]